MNQNQSEHSSRGSATLMDETVQVQLIIQPPNVHYQGMLNAARCLTKT